MVWYFVFFIDDRICSHHGLFQKREISAAGVRERGGGIVGFIFNLYGPQNELTSFPRLMIDSGLDRSLVILPLRFFTYHCGAIFRTGGAERPGRLHGSSRTQQHDQQGKSKSSWWYEFRRHLHPVKPSIHPSIHPAYYLLV